MGVGQHDNLKTTGACSRMLEHLRMRFASKQQIQQRGHPAPFAFFSLSYFANYINTVISGDPGFALHPLAAQDITEIWEYTAISGILVFDWKNGNHWFFGNPYARLPLANHFFPSVKYTVLNRRFGSDLIDLSRLMFLGEYP